MQPQAKIFRFCDYQFDAKHKKATFHYRIEFFHRDPLEFTETLILPNVRVRLKRKIVDKFLEPLHLILGVSYYKLYCPRHIKTSIPLSREQAHFWNTVYRKGLGEFLYRNKRDPNHVAKFPYTNTRPSPVRVKTRDRSLVGIGGGKDSIVAAELLKNFDTASFHVETQREDAISKHVMREMGKPVLKIQRILDPKIFATHEGAYNGHIPISAVYAFLGIFAAAMYEYRYVIVANEQSSNFGNLRYRGEMINHQWSKSAEFEALFQAYVRKFMTPDSTYFSLLRPLYEIRIAQLFAQHKKYFPLFSSCNRSFTVFQERSHSFWCGECSKCVFVFLILASFLKKKELLGIFHKNLFAETALVPLFQDVLGFGKRKPFDCVGTFEESQAALFLASKKWKNDVVIKTFLPKIKNPQKRIQRVFKTVPALTLPTPFRFLGIQNVCMLGYGKEGKVTKKYIQKNYPSLKIGILDQNRQKNYLERQQDFDLAIKTPGIPKTNVTIPYVTATNIFFSRNKNFTIGVTGSKGKSTTASLISAMLKAAGKKVRLIGNIGNPMLEVLLTRVDPEEIFVIELSSYMLEDIEYSPDIALLLNLFPEHMDYHGGIQRYYEAKKNIFQFQKSGNFAIQPPFTEKIPLKKNEIPLRGMHNLKNIQAAIAVVRLLHVSDSAIRKGIKNFKPLPHRLEYVGTYKGIQFYDDAISTTPESTIEAIKTLKHIGTIFLGGEDRGYDFRKLEKTLRKQHIHNIVLFPTSGHRILSSRRGLNILKTKSMKEAVSFAFRHTPEGHICLLSTASPSYSLWKNFEEKGNLFQRCVKRRR